MHSSLRRAVFLFLFVCFVSVSLSAVFAQTNSGTVNGTVTDPTGAVVPGATVTIQNPVSGYMETVQANHLGEFQFANLPFNHYHLTAVATGFGSVAEDANVESSVPMKIKITLTVQGSSSTITVDAGDLLENDTTMHTDLDRRSFSKLPIESQSSSVSSLVTLMSPGVAADSNGLFHGLGDHASNSFSVDGQPITDQQSKVFSNQIPINSIQSVQVIDGAPPAEYGDKTSLVIVVTTRSGLGVTKPTGGVTSSYGSFGSSTGGFDLSYGGKNWGNFLSADGLNTGRFLDGPEFKVFHDKGNEENFFDRADYQFASGDSAHLNLNYTRSWFQTPNAYDNLNVQNVISGGSGPDPVFGNVGNTDQKSKIGTFNIAPTYTRLLNQYSVWNMGAYVRKDAYDYYPSENPFADLGPPNLQNQTIGQKRTLLNAGVHSDVSYSRGIHNVKAGAVYEQTILRESDDLSIVANLFNAPCVDSNGNSVPGFSDPSECLSAGYQSNPSYLPVLAPYDLTRGGGYYHYIGHTDVKELALYIEDQIKTGNWLFNLGMRGDLYNGLTVARQAEPRVGLAYQVKRTNTVLRASYARTLETPFNENLVLSSQGCSNAVLAPLLACTPGVSGTLQPGYRNEFHAGLQQTAGKYLVVSGDYIWKYTHNAFDFSVLGNTPITFPIDWHNSKITGFTLRADVPTIDGVSAFVVMSSVAARFFPPQTAGAGATVGQSGLPFRIDHDEKYNETTHLQYQFGRRGPWFGFNWRFDSGLVAGSVPFATDTTTPVDLTGLTADQQQQAGLACGNRRATLTTPLTTCAPSLYHSSLVSIPAPGTENDDHNPPRIAPRSLFDIEFGDDNLFNGKKYKWSATLTAINVTNKYALYNFLSTFSGTHYVTPRALTGQIGFNF
ncbi:MAG: carboxypeptidase regulatory-like domain-containing protein [Acidobacteriaceae bacterium]